MDAEKEKNIFGLVLKIVLVLVGAVIVLWLVRLGIAIYLFDSFMSNIEVMEPR